MQNKQPPRSRRIRRGWQSTIIREDDIEIKHPAWAGFGMEGAYWRRMQDICLAEDLTYRQFIQIAEQQHPHSGKPTAVRIEIINYIRKSCSAVKESQLQEQTHSVMPFLKPTVPLMDKRIRILVVDDDPDVRVIVAAHLSTAGFTIITASSGDEAMKVLSGGEGFGLIIVDLGMVGMNGIELLSEVKIFHPALPGLIISGSTSTLLSDVEHLIKPFRREELILKVESLIGSRQTSSENLAESSPIVNHQ
jgi:CheY-like chemotaxis protein